MRKAFLNLHFLFWFLAFICFITYLLILSKYIFPFDLSTDDVLAMAVPQAKTLLLSMGGTIIFSVVAFIAALFRIFAQDHALRMTARNTAVQSALFVLVSIFLFFYI